MDRARPKEHYQTSARGEAETGDEEGTERKRGRPVGSKTGANQEVVETIPAACPHCGHTRRKCLRIVRERAIGGVSPAGHPRTHIIWRRVQCDSCRGYFVEMSHENRG
jgi:hypothetical protein